MGEYLRCTFFDFFGFITVFVFDFFGFITVFFDFFGFIVFDLDDNLSWFKSATNSDDGDGTFFRRGGIVCLLYTIYTIYTIYTCNYSFLSHPADKNDGVTTIPSFMLIISIHEQFVELPDALSTTFTLPVSANA